jgi:hypothetical protein
MGGTLRIGKRARRQLSTRSQNPKKSTSTIFLFTLCVCHFHICLDTFAENLKKSFCCSRISTLSICWFFAVSFSSVIADKFGIDVSLFYLVANAILLLGIECENLCAFSNSFFWFAAMTRGATTASIRTTSVIRTAATMTPRDTITPMQHKKVQYNFNKSGNKY